MSRWAGLPAEGCWVTLAWAFVHTLRLTLPLPSFAHFECVSVIFPLVYVLVKHLVLRAFPPPQVKFTWHKNNPFKANNSVAFSILMMLGDPHFYLFQNFGHSRMKSRSWTYSWKLFSGHSPFSLSAAGNHHLSGFQFLRISLFWIFHRKGRVWYVTFCVRVCIFQSTPLRFNLHQQNVYC